jgi:hypothetical protein
MRDKFNETYMKYFTNRVPTRRLVGAGDMFLGIRVEIDADLMLADINADGMQKTVEQIESLGRRAIPEYREYRKLKRHYGESTSK